MGVFEAVVASAIIGATSSAVIANQNKPKSPDVTPVDPTAGEAEARKVQARSRGSREAAVARLGGTGRNQLSAPGLFSAFRKGR